MRARLAFGGVLLALVVGGVGLAGPVSPARAAIELLPNITPLPASDLSIDNARNKTYLRLSTTSWNKGAGALEIRGGDTDRQTGRQKVMQRIYNDGGGYRDVLAGWFSYHKQHRHIHFDDYATFSLEAIDSAEVKSAGSKQTFCIIDTDHVNASTPNSPTVAKYFFCNSHVQGMSVGWGDTYGSHLDGQSIDITRVPDGEYNLKTVIDPKNKIIESDETDNTNVVRIRIQAGSVTTVQ